MKEPFPSAEGGPFVGKEFNRRTFLQLSGLGLGAGLILPACTDAPVQRLHAALTPPKELVPGRADWFATVCRDCPAACGLSVRCREGRPVKLEGLAQSPVNQGRLCARGQSALQALYDPDRLHRPRLGRGAQAKELGDEQALAWVGERLNRARTSSVGRMALLSGMQTGAGAFFFSSLADRLKASWLPYETLLYWVLSMY